MKVGPPVLWTEYRCPICNAALIQSRRKKTVLACWQGCGYFTQKLKAKEVKPPRTFRPYRKVKER